MPTLLLNSQPINYTLEKAKGLKHIYIKITPAKGVVVRGRNVTQAQAERLLTTKANWVLQKLKEMEHHHPITHFDIEKGIAYFGEIIPVEVGISEHSKRSFLRFEDNHIVMILSSAEEKEKQIEKLIDGFYKEATQNYIPERIQEVSEQINLPFNKLSFRKMKRRWGSCSYKNDILINTYTTQLAEEVIDYLLVHELCHTKVKNHSRDFWNEVAKYLPNYRELDTRLRKVKF